MPPLVIADITAIQIIDIVPTKLESASISKYSKVWSEEIPTLPVFEHGPLEW